MFGRWLGRGHTPVIHSGALLLRQPKASDFEAWRRVRLASRDFLRPFEPRWSENDLTRAVFAARLRRGRKEAAAGTEFTFMVFEDLPEGERLMGGLTLSNIRRRAAQYVYLGYWMGVEDAGKGVMSHSVAAILPFVFETLGLHRINAACLPENMASRRVLEKNGFNEEGYAENYLQINGEWRDHVLYALTRERFLAQSWTS